MEASEMYNQLNPLTQDKLREATKALLRRFNAEEAVKLVDWYINFVDAHKEMFYE
jgi:hypothetical protein